MHWNELVDVAEGQSRPAAQAHADGCADCGARLAELRQMISLTAKGAFDAPTESVQRAKSVFVPRRPVVFANLVRQGAGARLIEAESRQIRIDEDGLAARLMIRKDGSRWQILGMIESTPLPESISAGAASVSITGPSFELTLDQLDDLWIEFSDRVVVLPINEQE